MNEDAPLGNQENVQNDKVWLFWNFMWGLCAFENVDFEMGFGRPR